MHNLEHNIDDLFMGVNFPTESIFFVTLANEIYSRRT